MKPFASLALALVLTASLLTGCGCTNQNMDPTSAPTVLPTNEEIWDNTETTRSTTGETTDATFNTDAVDTTETTGAEESTGTEEATTRSTIRNYVNSHTDMMDKIQKEEKSTAPSESSTSRSAGGTLSGSR